MDLQLKKPIQRPIRATSGTDVHMTVNTISCTGSFFLAAVQDHFFFLEIPHISLLLAVKLSLSTSLFYEVTQGKLLKTLALLYQQ